MDSATYIEAGVRHWHPLETGLVEVAGHVFDRRRVQLERQVHDVRVVHGRRDHGRRAIWLEIAIWQFVPRRVRYSTFMQRLPGLVLLYSMLLLPAVESAT